MQDIRESILKKIIKKRKSNTFKGNYGHLLLIGGNANYGGAIIMAAEAAINTGVGLTAVATHSVNLASLHARDPEAMFIDWRDRNLVKAIKSVDVVLCGPGLGMDNTAKSLMTMLRDNVTAKQIVILDANALDLIALDRSLLPTKAKTIIFTPHQMEWQRLSQIRIPYQNDSANYEALNQLVPNKNAILVLKSNHTTVYDQYNVIQRNPIGNPGMATGGMGDTLGGIIAGMVAQFGAEIDTVSAAVYLHSLAGDEIAKEDYVVKPTKISALIPCLMKKYEGE